MTEIVYPKYLVRPDDFRVFKLNNNFKYISGKMSTTEHSYETLIALGFYEATDEDLPELKKKSDIYYDWLHWSTRPDGHGGVEGGTMEEYLDIIEKSEDKWRKYIGLKKISKNT